jgi:hypothetical protein
VSGSRLSRSIARFAFAALASGALFPACHRQTATTADQAVLDRRRQGLAGLMAAARRGSLLPFSKMLVVADERLVQQVMAATLPFERVIVDRYRIRVSRAEVHFDDGFGLVRLDGEASFADRPETEGHAEVTVFGGLDVVALDPESGVLRGSVKIIALDARRVNVYGVKSSIVEDLVEQLGREKLDSFSALASAIEIPVRLERSVTLPAVGPGEVRIDAATIPVRAAVSDVKAFGGKLWVSVDVSTDAATPGPASGTPSPAPEGSAR